MSISQCNTGSVSTHCYLYCNAGRSLQGHGPTDSWRWMRSYSLAHYAPYLARRHGEEELYSSSFTILGTEHSFMPRSHYLKAKRSRVHLVGGGVGPTAGLDMVACRKPLPSLGIQNRLTDLSALKLVTILTELSRHTETRQEEKMV
jgi:hypothetical protein